MAGKSLRAVAGAGLAAGVAAGCYWAFVRPWCMTLGATPDEVAAELPGDELLPEADSVATRAVMINAPPSAIWPWLLQMGGGRGGGYSYDWIENLFRLDVHSAEVILPQFQNMQVGDEYPIGRSPWNMRVAILDPERTLTLQIGKGACVRIFALLPCEGGTRLVIRTRIALRRVPAALAPPYLGLLEPVGLMMERKKQRGIKERAERLARERAQGIWYSAPV